jgi:hypothetical protein
MLFTIGCKEDESPLLKALDASTFECQERETDYYFEGTLNGDKVCYHVGYDNYGMALRKSTGFTSGATVDPINPSGTSRIWGTFSIEPLSPWQHLDQFFQIETPKFVNSNIEKDSIIRATIKIGDLPLTDEMNNDDAFNLKVVIWSKNGFENSEGGQVLPLQTGGGEQKDSYLKITELESSEVGSKRFYTITFEFECDLYIAGDGDKKFGRIDDGKMRIWVEVEK